MLILVSFIHLSINVFSIGEYVSIDENCWSNKELVSSESNQESYRGIIKVDDEGTVHVAWKDHTDFLDSGDDWDIFYKKKPVNGNWTDTEIVSSESSGNSNCLSLFVEDNGIVHVGWKDQTDILDSGDDWDIFYKKKPVNGNWTDTEIVSTESSGVSNCPFLIVDDLGIIHFVWPDESDFMSSGLDIDIFYKKKLLDGNWTETEIISNDSVNDSLRPQLGFDSNNSIYVVWEESSNWFDSGYDSDIFFKFILIDDDWSDVELVSFDSLGQSVSCSIMVESDGTVHVVWIDNSYGDFDVFYNCRSVNGFWFNTELVSTESLRICNWARIDVDSNHVIHVVWNDETVYEKSSSDSDIIYKYKALNGNWSDFEIVSFDSHYDSFWPSISVEDNGFAHVSWWDDEGAGRWVTYYKMRSCEDFELFNDSNDEIIDDTPGFNLIIFCFALISFIFLMKKRWL